VYLQQVVFGAVEFLYDFGFVGVSAVALEGGLHHVGEEVEAD
jgi:hypothetical protein